MGQIEIIVSNHLHVHLLPDYVYNQNYPEDSSNTPKILIEESSVLLVMDGRISLVRATHRHTTGDGCSW
jgi:hypothetical protein